MITRTARLLVAALCAALLAAPAGAAEPFRVGAHRSVHGSWEVVAHRLGYFKEAGLDYTMQYFKQGKLIAQALLTNNLDVGTVGVAAFVTTVAQGAKLTAIAVTANICGTEWIVVPADSKAKGVRDLKGATFAVRSGEGTDFAFRSYVLPKHGMAESDLRWLNIATTDRVAAMLAGNAQAAVLDDPQAEIARNKGLVRFLEDFCPYDNIRMMHAGNPMTLKTNPGAYEKYFRAWLRAHELKRTDPEKFARVYTGALAEVGDKGEYPVVLAVVKRLRSEPALTPEVKAYMVDMAEKQKRLGWIKRVPRFDQGEAVDGSIFEKVSSQKN
ncbi:MAG: ABC transporter substrate-binding protein [Nitrospinota bacterium]